MIIDAMPIGQASRLIPGHPHLSTLIRWATRGCGGVKLSARRVGHRWFVSEDAIRRFVEELNRDADERLVGEGL